MLGLILIVGGRLIMMGQHDRSEALFYYFRLEDQVPETHLLRLIERHISFAFVRAPGVKLKLGRKLASGSTPLETRWSRLFGSRLSARTPIVPKDAGRQ